MAVQNDGKIIAGGTLSHTYSQTAWALVRYLPNGKIDRSFGNKGRVVTDITDGRDLLARVLVLGDGKIVAAGTGGSSFAAVRYMSDGHKDPTFGHDGVVRVNFSAGLDGANDLRLAPGGKLVLAGGAEPGGVGAFAVARLNPDGSLDATFGGDGRRMTGFGTTTSYAANVLVHADGSMLVSGRVGTEVGLVTYGSSGVLDPAFGDQGRRLIDTGTNMFPRGMLQLKSGRVMLGGNIQKGSDISDCDAALLRLNADGTPDESFGPTGLVTQDFTYSDFISGLARAGGKFVLPMTVGAVFGSDQQLAVVRLNNDGSADTSFGNQGFAAIHLDGGYAGAIAVQPDGRILVGGADLVEGPSNMALARFLTA
ncbi:MAG TPA: hypothetical protein VNN79_23200 [Actinomycetota bacterium]|nr:hypothetical protein [Actinomycetota bacterium]